MGQITRAGGIETDCLLAKLEGGDAGRQRKKFTKTDGKKSKKLKIEWETGEKIHVEKRGMAFHDR